MIYSSVGIFWPCTFTPTNIVQFRLLGIIILCIVFGVKSHGVSCKLLEYGYLAVCSRHRLV